MKTSPPRIGFVSLGCPKALVDSERIVTQLRREGYVISPTYQESDLIIVNTCGFIDTAIEESLDAIGEALQENGKVIVTGCLGARKEDILARYPSSILDITGPHADEAVVKAVHTHCPPPHAPFLHLVPSHGLKLTPPHYAYLKISEGCNHRCSFCIIPLLRGNLVSRPIHELMTEAESLVEAGVKEILVISQDTSAYGVDLQYREATWKNHSLETRFYDLAHALGTLGVWIRLHYVYPYPHVDKVIPLMAEGKILPYLDIPFQHASERILKLMKRPAATEDILHSIARWRSVCPDVTLRSTFIVGFPGETEEEFEHLLDFLEEAQLDRVGCFTYSAVSGAEANNLPNPIPEEVKEERMARLMETQAYISAARLQTRVGSRETVLIDEVDEEGAVARGRGEAPEIDGQVYIPGASHLTTGEYVDVTIYDTDEYDLWATLTS